MLREKGEKNGETEIVGFRWNKTSFFLPASCCQPASNPAKQFSIIKASKCVHLYLLNYIMYYAAWKL